MIKPTYISRAEFADYMENEGFGKTEFVRAIVNYALKFPEKKKIVIFTGNRTKLSIKKDSTGFHIKADNFCSDNLTEPMLC